MTERYPAEPGLPELLIQAAIAGAILAAQAAGAALSTARDLIRRARG